MDELFHQFRDEDVIVFEQLYKFHRNSLFQTIKNYIKDEDLAKDILQELWLRIWMRRREIDLNRPYYAFLFTVAKHLAIDRQRKASKEATVLKSYRPGKNIGYLHVEEMLISKQCKAMVRDAVERLPKACGKIYKMRLSFPVAICR